jgi:hypothetical protein
MIRELIRRIRQWNIRRKLLEDFRQWMLRPYASHSPSFVPLRGKQYADEVKRRIALEERPIDADTLAKIKKRYNEIMGIEDGDNESN